jgi:uncharacterized membrane protein YphA (DoxX/SURF4 family)
MKDPVLPTLRKLRAGPGTGPPAPHRSQARGGATRIVPWLATAARLLVGGVFLVAGAVKLPDPATAVRAVRAYELLPEPLVGPVAFGLPVIEIGVGLALVAGVFTRAAAVAAAVLLVVFIAAVASVWARGLQIDCGCFSDGGAVAAGETAYPQEIARDVALLVVAAALAWRPASRLALGGSRAAPGTSPSEEEEPSRAR